METSLQPLRKTRYSVKAINNTNSKSVKSCKSCGKVGYKEKRFWSKKKNVHIVEQSPNNVTGKRAGRIEFECSSSANPPQNNQPKPPYIESEEERLPYVKFNCTSNLFSDDFVLMSNDIHVITCAQAKIGNTLQDKATNAVANPYASQLIDNSLGEAINQSQNPPENTKLKDVNVSFSLETLKSTNHTLATDIGDFLINFVKIIIFHVEKILTF